MALKFQSLLRLGEIEWVDFGEIAEVVLRILADWWAIGSGEFLRTLEKLTLEKLNLTIAKRVCRNSLEKFCELLWYWLWKISADFWEIEPDDSQAWPLQVENIVADPKRYRHVHSLNSFCVAVCCSVLQCVAVCCSVLQCVNSRVYVFSYSCTKHRCWSKELPPPAQPESLSLAQQNKADSVGSCDYCLCSVYCATARGHSTGLRYGVATISRLL